MARRENSPTLYTFVKDHIMKLIISGKYPAHTQLPTEFELMDQLHVGRATVRTALSQLENEGTIYKRQGVGTFVSERNRHYGLEPFISLSFMLKHLGINNKNEILTEREITVEDVPLTEGWNPGDKVYYIKRLRKTDQTLLAIEEDYYTPFAFSKLNQKDLDGSLSHNLLTNLDTPIERFTAETIVRDPTEAELAEFGLKEPEKIVELTRWMYFETVKDPVNYVIFRVPSHVLEFPFLG
ncbi:MAG: GntR family transcriptional regulator [Clostridia bacterium]|nr:GntR family transcriptional regulator [Clostridia bacterium]